MTSSSDLPPLFFRFHDIACISVSSQAAFARDFFTAEYGYHLVESAPAELPRISLDFQLDASSPEGFTRHTHKLLARWNYALEIRPGSLDLRVHGNRPAVSMVHHMLLHPSLRWLAAGRGSLLLHAGAVARGGRSLIFTGKGGAGKTTTTSLVLASGRGWQIHADDYVFLGAGQSQAYVTRSHLYRDLQKWVPAVTGRLTHWERARLEFFGALRQHSREGLKWPVRLSPGRLWPGTPIAASASPAAVLLLERADVPKAALLPVKDVEATAHDLLEMNFSEARHFLTLLRKAGMLDQAWLADWKSTELRLLRAALAAAPTYRLVLPLTASQADSGAVQAQLLPLLDELV